MTSSVDMPVIPFKLKIFLIIPYSINALFKELIRKIELIPKFE
jgi:hypothetical protein